LGSCSAASTLVGAAAGQMQRRICSGGFLLWPNVTQHLPGALSSLVNVVLHLCSGLSLRFKCRTTSGSIASGLGQLLRCILIGGLWIGADALLRRRGNGLFEPGNKLFSGHFPEPIPEGNAELFTGSCNQLRLQDGSQAAGDRGFCRTPAGKHRAQPQWRIKNTTKFKP
jgi:hypothetical protein